MTIIKYKFTSIKEEMPSVLFIEPHSVSSELVVVMNSKELLSYFSNHSEDGATILNFRENASAEPHFQRNNFRESRGHTSRQ
jgi:hypothetical protein